LLHWRAIAPEMLTSIRYVVSVDHVTSLHIAST
jgi:hypothetical protein